MLELWRSSGGELIHQTMAKPRKKKHTHVRVNDAASGPGKAGVTSRPPKSMVVRTGAEDVGSGMKQLELDFRAMMGPDTAIRLKVSRTYYQSIRPGLTLTGTESEQT